MSTATCRAAAAACRGATRPAATCKRCKPRRRSAEVTTYARTLLEHDGRPGQLHDGVQPLRRHAPQCPAGHYGQSQDGRGRRGIVVGSVARGEVGWPWTLRSNGPGRQLTADPRRPQRLAPLASRCREWRVTFRAGSARINSSDACQAVRQRPSMQASQQLPFFELRVPIMSVMRWLPLRSDCRCRCPADTSDSR